MGNIVTLGNIVTNFARFVRGCDFDEGWPREVLVSPDDFQELRQFLDANRMIYVDGMSFYINVDLGLLAGTVRAPTAAPVQ